MPSNIDKRIDLIAAQLRQLIEEGQRDAPDCLPRLRQTIEGALVRRVPPGETGE